MTAPSGARLPRRIAMPAFALNGSSKVLITSRFQHGRLAMFSPIVLPLAVIASLLSTPSISLQHRGQSAGVVEIFHEELARRLQVHEAGQAASRACPSPRARACTPSRPAMANRCTTELVEPPMAALALIAFSNAWRVRIFDSTRSSRTISTMRRPRQLRQPVAARIDRGNRRVAG